MTLLADDYSLEEIETEVDHIGRVMTTEEIFAEGFYRGLQQAGLSSNYEPTYRAWIAERLERNNR